MSNKIYQHMFDIDNIRQVQFFEHYIYYGNILAENVIIFKHI